MAVLINGIGKLSGLLSVFVCGTMGKYWWVYRMLKSRLERIAQSLQDILIGGNVKWGAVYFRITGQRPKPKFTIKPLLRSCWQAYTSSSSNAGIEVHGDHLFDLRIDCRRALREAVLPLQHNTLWMKEHNITVLTM